MNQDKAKRNATKADFKRWADTDSYKDLVDFAKKCYNEYNENSQNLGLPKDVRMSYLDQAVGFQKVIDYINRQLK